MRVRRYAHLIEIFQSPFHRGNGCNTMGPMRLKVRRRCFQSPFHRGNGCNEGFNVEFLDCIITFSPLFIGAMVVTLFGQNHRIAHSTFQSPFHRGNGCNFWGRRRRRFWGWAFSPLFIGAMVVTPVRVHAKGGIHWLFQSPFHRGNGCNFVGWCVGRVRLGLSVPFSSGQWL